jgi:hypothetical protein
VALVTGFWSERLVAIELHQVDTRLNAFPSTSFFPGPENKADSDQIDPEQ